MSGRIPGSRVLFRDLFQVMDQDLTLVCGNIFERDAQGESFVNDPLLHMDNPGLDLDWNAVDGKSQMDHLIAKQLLESLEFRSSLAQVD